MSKRPRAHLTYSNIVSTLCLFVLLGGVGYAAANLPRDSVRSKQIKAGAVKNAELATNAVSSPKVRDGSLLASDFASGQLPQGPRGSQGPQGDAGANGSPDTPVQVRDKLLQVDGAGSGLDADTIDGTDSSVLAHIVYSTSQSYDPPNLTAGTCANVALQVPGGVLHSGDSLVVTPSGLMNYALQFNGSVRANVGFIYSTVCNNGQFGAIDEGLLTVNYLVIR